MLRAYGSKVQLYNICKALSLLAIALVFGLGGCGKQHAAVHNAAVHKTAKDYCDAATASMGEYYWHPEEAIKIADQCLAAFPKDPATVWTQFRGAEGEFHTRQYSKALARIARIRKSMSILPKEEQKTLNGHLKYLEEETHLRMGSKEAFRDAVLVANSNTDSSIDALNRLVGVVDKSTKDDAAQMRSLGLNPGNADDSLVYNAVMAISNMEDFNAAKAYVSKLALESSSRAVVDIVCLEIGGRYINSQDPVKSAYGDTLIKKAVTSRNDRVFAEAELVYADRMREKGNLVAAKGEILNILNRPSAESNFDKANYYLANYCIYEKNYKQAIGYYERVKNSLVKSSYQPAAKIQIACLYRTQIKDYTKCEPMLLEMVNDKKYPADAYQAAIELGLLYAERGDCKAADHTCTLLKPLAKAVRDNTGSESEIYNSAMNTFSDSDADDWATLITVRAHRIAAHAKPTFRDFVPPMLR